MIPLRRALQGV